MSSSEYKTMFGSMGVAFVIATAYLWIFEKGIYAVDAPYWFVIGILCLIVHLLIPGGEGV